MIPNLAYGGAEKVLVNLVNNLDRKKFDITVMVLFAGGVNAQFLKKDIKYKFCYKKSFRGNSKYFCLFSPEYLFKKFIKCHYDIIVSYLEGVTSRIISGCTDRSTKIVSWIHCKMDTKESGSIGFRNFDEAKRCYNRFDYIACVSNMVKDYFIETFDFKKDIGVLYNTIEADEIRKKSNETSMKVSFSKDCFNICSVGKIISVKNFMRLAKVHKKLLDDGIKNRVYILGIGNEKSLIEKYLIENNIADTFTFLGYDENPYKYVRKCDLYVCSSNSEGFSTSVTESLIVGTPVVTTLCSGMHEMLGTNDEYGIVTENCEDALYVGVKRILTTEGLLEHYAKQAGERGKLFDTQTTTVEVEKMLLGL